MKIGTPKETFIGEARVAMTPESALQLQKLGHECLIETGAGLAAGFSDAVYKDAGVTVVKTAAASWKAADTIAKVRPPNSARATHLAQPFHELSLNHLYHAAIATQRPRTIKPRRFRRPLLGK